MHAIPQAAPGLKVLRRRPDIDRAMARVVDRGIFILGPETEAFEREFAAYLGLPHAVGVSSGTDAIVLALEALGVGPDDEVLVPALTAPATAAAVLRVGARPKFVDVEPYSRGMDPELVRRAASPLTKAIIVVHLHGIPARIRELAETARSLGLPLVEDCAQAHGTRVDGQPTGCFGDAAAFSFYPTKNLGGLGDGGCVATHSAELAERVRRRRFYGFNDKGLCTEAGMNCRLDEIQSAILRSLLPYLDGDNSERLQFARFYDALLSEIGQPLGIALPPRLEGNVYHQYAITLRDRDGLMRALAAQGVTSLIHYAVPLHRHPVFAKASGALNLTFPVAERLASSLLSLPIQPELRQYEASIAGALKSAVGILRA